MAKKPNKPRAFEALRHAKNTGRPRKEGARTASGRLLPPPPNELVLARRAAICADPAMATCPLDAAYANGWLTRREYGAANAYVAVHKRAGLGGPGARQVDPSLPTGAAIELADRWSELSERDVRSMRLSQLPDKELVLIWDSALRDLGRMADPEKAEQFAVEANRRWRALNAIMTSFERVVVDSFCIRETWPRWFWERVEGRMASEFEEERTVLLSGLRSIAGALDAPKSIVRSDLAAPAARRQSSVHGKPEHVADLAFTDVDTGDVLRTVRVERARRWPRGGA